ncbi:VirB3 family type IV secretion system protein [Nisaea sediminum]|uniref:VirB3 family type IV secretion system protein n=1 Tax=Nisaea sediminum TaxID=2775867 RepID=UPI0018677F2C
MFEEPVPQSLTKRILVLGLPRELGILIGTLTAVGFFALHRFEPVIAGIILVMVGNIIHRKDEWTFEILMRHARYKSRYLP